MVAPEVVGPFVRPGHERETQFLAHAHRCRYRDVLCSRLKNDSTAAFVTADVGRATQGEQGVEGTSRSASTCGREPPAGESSVLRESPASALVARPHLASRCLH